MKRTKVIVCLVAECEVEIEVEHEDGEDPTDLVKEDIEEARKRAASFPRWDVDKVREAR